MLWVSLTELLENFVNEKTSPEAALNGLGSFKYQRITNPLEQLGITHIKETIMNKKLKQECVLPIVDEWP